jgi:hypothetical protein
LASLDRVVIDNPAVSRTISQGSLHHTTILATQAGTLAALPSRRLTFVDTPLNADGQTARRGAADPS